MTSYKPPDTAEGLLSLRKLTGGFTLLSIEQSAADGVRVRVRGNGETLKLMAGSSSPLRRPPRVSWLGFRLIPPGGVIEDVPLDAAGRKRVIEAVLSALRQNYVYPETAEKMAAAVLYNQQNRKYDGITDGGVLANQLHEDLRVVSHDRHLRVEWSPFKPPAQRRGPDPAAEARMQRELERNNCTFEKLEILPENVGYVKSNAFPAPEICGPTVAAAMISWHMPMRSFSTCATTGAVTRAWLHSSRLTCSITRYISATSTTAGKTRPRSIGLCRMSRESDWRRHLPLS